ncbi:MAG: class I SAM-dependent methyltransferase [Clostridiaceae bacterium]|nr:class I SAM-dependent methyltransferase [Clostridiaceae bacterium]
MSRTKFYENKEVQKTMGETLRPGGLKTTKRALEFCKFKKDDVLLDLGCGKGRTIKYVWDNYRINMWGLDISEELVREARELNKNSNICISSGDNTPFEDKKFNGVFAECTLSLMDNLENTINEINRIMETSGFLVISDVYAKNTEYLPELKSFDLDTCLKRPHNIDVLRNLLKDRGFKILLLENYDNFIIQLVGDIIFSYGSMENFFGCGGENCIDGKKFQDILKKSKIGYFLMIAQKEEDYVKGYSF